MKKIKLFLGIVLFGAMSFGAFSAYEHYTMTAEELALLENVEALTSGEGESNWRNYSTYCSSCRKSTVPSCMWDAEGSGGNCTPSNCTSCGSTMGGYFH